MKLIVTIGSFNPITKSDYLIMESSINKIHADKGLFIISKDTDLIHKMVYYFNSTFILNEQTRSAMIETLTFKNNKIIYGGTTRNELYDSPVETIRKIINENL